MPRARRRDLGISLTEINDLLRPIHELAGGGIADLVEVVAGYVVISGEDVADTGVAVAQRTSNGFFVAAPCLGIIDLGAAIGVWVDRRLGLVGFAVGFFSRGIFPRHPSRALLQFGDGRNVRQVVEAERGRAKARVGAGRDLGDASDIRKLVIVERPVDVADLR